MEADLNNNFEYDKTLLYINSNNGIFDLTNFKFYIKFDETIKNPIAIKFIDATIITNILYTHGDEFYITLNDIERSTTFIKDQQNNINICKYFEMIPFFEEPYGNAKWKSMLSRGTGTTNWSDSGIYVLNPVVPRIDRFVIEVKDKNFNPIPIANIDSIKLNICVYTIKKNLT